MSTTFALFSGCFIARTLHYHTQHRLIVSFMYKAVFPPPADVGWSMNDGGISAVGRRRLEYELWKILTVGWEYQLHKPSLSIMCLFDVTRTVRVCLT